MFIEEVGEAGWWENGKYVLDPERMVLQIWYIISNICFFSSILSISGHFAFGLTLVNVDNREEIFYDCIFLIDIILVFFTAAEIEERQYV